jgi:hypothetical protein
VHFLGSLTSSRNIRSMVASVNTAGEPQTGMLEMGNETSILRWREVIASANQAWTSNLGGNHSYPRDRGKGGVQSRRQKTDRSVEWGRLSRFTSLQLRSR